MNISHKQTLIICSCFNGLIRIVQKIKRLLRSLWKFKVTAVCLNSSNTNVSFLWVINNFICFDLRHMPCGAVFWNTTNWRLKFFFMETSF